MRFKGTFVLFLVFAALGGYVYFTDFHDKEERTKQEEAKKRLFGGEAKDVTELTLEAEGRTITAVRKGETDWEITSPAGLEADPEAWEQLASSFVGIAKDEVVSAQKTDLAPYGLDKPGTAVRVKLQSGSAAGVLFGSENPKKTFNYAKRTDSDEVFLVATSSSGSFKKSLTDLRNKKVLEFESDNIDAVRIASAGRPDLEIRKSGTDWTIQKPLETRADAAEVMSFLSAIQFSRTSAFADENADAKLDAKSAGLDPPSVRITLHDQKAAADRTLLFGKSPEKDKYYAKDASRPAIFILATEIIDKARRPVGDWRDKTIVRFGETGSFGIDEMDIVRGTDKLSLKKTDSDWALTDGRKVQQSKISEMLNLLESERAVGFLDSSRALTSAGLDKPRLEVLLREKGKEVAAVRFGVDSSNPVGVYVKSQNPAIMAVSKALYDELNVNASDLVEVQPAQPGPGVPSK